jgi:Asp-tRNA(Asn)/Glu-tRNA(Gln) amidotransferase A subunit family amidase
MPIVAAVETVIKDAQHVSRAINAWEGRWPLNTYRERDVSKLSEPALARLKQAEAMTIEEYRGLLETRVNARTAYAALASEVAATIALPAPGAAPVGLDSTGNPACTVHASYLGIPSISLPLLRDEGLPLEWRVDPACRSGSGVASNLGSAFSAR